MLAVLYTTEGRHEVFQYGNKPHALQSSLAFATFILMLVKLMNSLSVLCNQSVEICRLYQCSYSIMRNLAHISVLAQNGLDKDWSNCLYFLLPQGRKACVLECSCVLSLHWSDMGAEGSFVTSHSPRKSISCKSCHASGTIYVTFPFEDGRPGVMIKNWYTLARSLK